MVLVGFIGSILGFFLGYHLGCSDTKRKQGIFTPLDADNPVTSRILKLLKATHECGSLKVTGLTTFHEANFDELDHMEWVMELEEEFRVEITDRHYEKCVRDSDNILQASLEVLRYAGVDIKDS